jgi:uncharacterized protein YyaL (SSP411 family)
MANHLSNEKSPYLLQHADNPVDWRPWSDETFRIARDQDKPVFLSVGYATCHWCHVMAHESFEDNEIAGILNENFISVKVDREERPDVDQIYMTVCQVLTGSGGWPMTVFMTPDKKPFFAGTYFPKASRMGIVGFKDIITQLSAMWKNDRDRILKAGQEITRAVQPKKKTAEEGMTLRAQTLNKAYDQLDASFSDKWGGFGRAPKFPTTHHLTFLLRWHLRSGEQRALEMVEETLDAMRKGGIFDHVGFGFHRYSVDERWLVPHFEKMLYDQAMIAMVYTEAYQDSGKAEYAQVTREIFEYVLRDMTAPEGGFYSAEDADSEGREGMFYVWRPEEVKEVLGEDAGQIFCSVYDIGSAGNFEEGWSIPHLSRPLSSYAKQFGMAVEDLEKTLEDARQKLFARREKRVHPFKDDKILASWNGLMIAALAKGFQVLGDNAYVDAARKAADFILSRLRSESGRLMRRYRDGDVAIPGYADDYAFLIWGLLELYEASFDIKYLEEAGRLNDQMIDIFWDEESGAFFYTGRDSETLIVRDKDVYDGATPSSNSVAALNLLRLGRMTGNPGLEEKADQLMRVFGSMVDDYPSAYTQFLHAVDFAVGPSQEVIVAAGLDQEETRSMVEAIRRTFAPNRVLMLRREGEEGGKLIALAPFMADLHSIDGKTTAYVCENYTCRKPVTSVEELELQPVWA